MTADPNTSDIMLRDEVEALAARFPRPRNHRSGEPLLDVVYADPGNNGFYYREEKPDSVTCYVRIDTFARSLLAAHDKIDRLRADAQAAVALVAEKAAKISDPWAFDTESANASRRYIAGKIRSLAHDTGVKALAELRAERDEALRCAMMRRERLDVAEAEISDLRARLAEAERQVKALRYSRQAMHRRAQKAEGKNLRSHSLLQSVSGFLHRQPDGPAIGIWWLKSYVDAAMEHARAGSNKAFTMHYHFFGERQRKLEEENRALKKEVSTLRAALSPAGEAAT